LTLEGVDIAAETSMKTGLITDVES